ncbi:MAG: molybdenum cofactor guanylyltransferase [Desulfobacterales bacterium]
MKGVTGVILAGGLNTRFGGREKALVEVNGRRILDRLLSAFEGFFDDVLLVTNHPLRYWEWDLRMASDLVSERSSLTGIHTALFYAATDHVFITACDLPFLKPAVIQSLLELIDHRSDVVLPETDGGIQPLCAVYSVRCLRHVEALLAGKQFQIRRFFPKVRMVLLTEDRLRKIDPLLHSFINVNTPEALAEAERMELELMADRDASTPTETHHGT